MTRRSLVLTATLLAAAVTPTAHAAFINTNDVSVYNAFALGATVQTFETIAGLAPLGILSYANTEVPAGAQLGGAIPGLHFHSGGGSFNDPVGTPGTPTAFLQLQGGIAGDARSGTNVIGSLEINTTTLNVSQFFEIIFTDTLRNRAGLWLNPSLGPVTITAFDSTGTSLENGIGTAGNFVGFQRPTNDIKFLSIVSTSATGFTADDLTYGVVGSAPPGGAAPEPASFALIAAAVPGVALIARRRRTARL